LSDEYLLDVLIFSSPSRPWRDVMVSGRWVVRDHRHDAEAPQAFKAAISGLVG
jgi:formimidoylglutamate deiminase